MLDRVAHGSKRHPATQPVVPTINTWAVATVRVYSMSRRDISCIAAKRSDASSQRRSA
jgi:hypothetical protein